MRGNQTGQPSQYREQAATIASKGTHTEEKSKITTDLMAYLSKIDSNE